MRNTTGCILVALALAAGGCLGLGSEDAVEKRYYAPEVVRPGEPRPTLPGTHVQVRPLRVSPLCEGTEMVYRLEDERWESDYYNLFFARPEDLLTTSLSRWLRASGAFEIVLDPQGRPSEQYAIEGNITNLHGDFRDSGRPLAVVELQVFLVHSPGVSPRLVRQGTYREEIPVGDDTVASLVGGWEDALTRIFTAVEEDVLGAIRRDR